MVKQRNFFVVKPGKCTTQAWVHLIYVFNPEIQLSIHVKIVKNIFQMVPNKTLTHTHTHTHTRGLDDFFWYGM